MATMLAAFERHKQRLKEIRPRVLVGEFGGAAGTLSSLGKDGLKVQDELMKELKLGQPEISWHTVRDRIAEVGCFLGLVTGSCGKIAFDVKLLMQTEVEEVYEPFHAGRGSSSTMPQKRNPIASEYILAAARTVHALVPVMLGAMAADHERATGPWQAELLALPQTFVLTHGALQHASAIAEGMVVDAERMRRNLGMTHGLIVSEAVMMGLAPHLGRGEAHHVVKHACDVALAEKLSLADALLRDPTVAARVDRTAIEQMTDPAHYLGSAGAFIDRVLHAARAIA
jgi:3-carboxy-cis,cis-muconate cycloisomerase